MKFIVQQLFDHQTQNRMQSWSVGYWERNVFRCLGVRNTQEEAEILIQELSGKYATAKT